MKRKHRAEFALVQILDRDPGCLPRRAFFPEQFRVAFLAGEIHTFLSPEAARLLQLMHDRFDLADAIAANAVSLFGILLPNHFRQVRERSIDFVFHQSGARRCAAAPDSALIENHHIQSFFNQMVRDQSAANAATEDENFAVQVLLESGINRRRLVL